MVLCIFCFNFKANNKLQERVSVCKFGEFAHKILAYDCMHRIRGNKYTQRYNFLYLVNNPNKNYDKK